MISLVDDIRICIQPFNGRTVQSELAHFHLYRVLEKTVSLIEKHNF